MTVIVHLFGQVRDLAGTSRLDVPCNPGTTVGKLRDMLAQTIPGLGAILPRCAVAVNQDFAGDDIAVTAESEVAVIPPVSGG
jgi:molybdopterin converting factor subunit 1